MILVHNSSVCRNMLHVAYSLTLYSTFVLVLHMIICCTGICDYLASCALNKTFQMHLKLALWKIAIGPNNVLHTIGSL